MNDPDTQSPESQNIDALKQMVIDTLDMNKGEEIVVIDLHDKSTIADYMVIASGTSSRHAVALAHKVMDELAKNHPGRKARVEGMAEADWVLLDMGDIIVHIFRPEVRNFYSLEKMWSATSVVTEHKRMGSKASSLNDE